MCPKLVQFDQKCSKQEKNTHSLYSFTGKKNARNRHQTAREHNTICTVRTERTIPQYVSYVR